MVGYSCIDAQLFIIQKEFCIAPVWSIFTELLPRALLIRAILVPLTLPSLKAQKQMTKLQPELKKLKALHKNDVKAMQQAQMDLYKKHNLNPLAGCLPQLVQLGTLIVLYQALLKFLGQSTVNAISIEPSFLWMNLAHPDTKFIMPVLAGVTQLILSIMILPGGEIPDLIPENVTSKKLKVANKKEEDTAGHGSSNAKANALHHARYDRSVSY